MMHTKEFLRALKKAKEVRVWTILFLGVDKQPCEGAFVRVYKNAVRDQMAPLNGGYYNARLDDGGVLYIG